VIEEMAERSRARVIYVGKEGGTREMVDDRDCKG
jgi:hypothetical protein